MGIYKVQNNGKAPQGLSVGDQVVTGGGTYVITGVRPDGSYSSVLYNSGQTTYNYRGGYDLPGGASGSGGSSPLSGLGSLDAPGAEALEKYYLKLLEQTLSGGSPVSTASGGVISLQEAASLANQALAPGYAAAYRKSAAQAAQRLDKAGLYDTVYGQALAARAEDEVSDALNAAVYKLALELTSQSADYTAAQQRNALNYLLRLLELKSDAELQSEKLRSNEEINREKLAAKG
ncbi:MAG: hypothetical protein IKD93_08490 [Firmicutes bacterium]|nr:hypothetical protein [Bacillota bacterium]